MPSVRKTISKENIYSANVYFTCHQNIRKNAQQFIHSFDNFLTRKAFIIMKKKQVEK